MSEMKGATVTVPPPSFAVDMLCSDSSHDMSIAVDIISAAFVSGNTINVVIEDDSGFPTSPEVVLGVGNWFIEYSAGTKFYLETLPTRKKLNKLYPD